MKGNMVGFRVTIKKNAILLFVFGIAALLLSFSSNAFSGTPLSSANFLDFKEKKEAPDFILKDMEDNPVRLSAFKGKVVLLYFWTTW
jgi:cytochrome oxidase Cu insertion factor (SCO1/SenC/PrrC family)